MEGKGKGSPLQLLLTLYGEESTLFRRDFACGEIGYRKKWGPLLAYARHKSAPQIYSVPPPLSLHDVGADSISARLK